MTLPGSLGFGEFGVHVPPYKFCKKTDRKSEISKIEENNDKKGVAVRELSGSTVRFMYCYTQVICRYWKEKTFFRIFF